MARSELVSQLKVAVGLEPLWAALTVDFRSIVTEIVPDDISSAELLEGDGGLGSVILFNFGPHDDLKGQKEKIVELDESAHKISLEVMEGGHLTRGFKFFMTGFKFTAVGENETLVDIIVTYECDGNEKPTQTQKFEEGFIRALEKYLQPAAAAAAAANP